MKTSNDPRHIERRRALKELFAESFSKKQTTTPLASSVVQNLSSIDKVIIKSAPDWPLESLNKVDLAVLRLAVYELSKASVPPKVVIDEAVELAKEFGSENSASFVNGVLGSIYSEQKYHAKPKQ